MEGIIKFSAYVVKASVGVMVTGALMKVLHRFAPIKFTWIWPSPFAQSARADEGGHARGTEGASRVRTVDRVAEAGRDATENFLSRCRQPLAPQPERGLRPGSTEPPESQPKEGDRISFVYSRCSRAGQRREDGGR